MVEFKKTYCLLLLLNFCQIQCEDLRFFHPVIFVPGDGGSRLEAKANFENCWFSFDNAGDWDLVWLSAYWLNPFAISCWVENIKLKYDPETRTTRNNDGVETRIPGFADTWSVERIGSKHDTMIGNARNYFISIVEALVDLGYKRGVDIHGAPYDFRKAANEQGEYFDKVTKLIEDTYLRNGNKSVIIISHSMGSTMMLYMLNHKDQAWKDKYIRAQISLAGVWAGTVRAMKVNAVGDDLGSQYINRQYLKIEQRTNPSLHWLMPNLDYWPDDTVFVQSPTVNVTKKNFEDFYTFMNLTDGLNMWKDTRNLIKDLKAPGVEIHCLYGSGMETTEKLIFNDFPHGSWVRKTGDGDGTVNLRSLEACKGWPTKQRQPVFFKKFFRINHLEMLKEQSVIGHVQEVVRRILEESLQD